MMTFRVRLYAPLCVCVCVYFVYIYKMPASQGTTKVFNLLNMCIKKNHWCQYYLKADIL